MVLQPSSYKTSIAVSLFKAKTAALRAGVILFPLLFFTQCFQVTQILDWRDDESMNVRWAFRFSKALEQAQSTQAQEKKNTENLSSQVEKANKEIPAKLRDLVKNLEIKKIDSEFDSGIELSFKIDNYAKFPFEKLQKDDFPMIPKYFPTKKQVVFRFEPMKKPGDQKKEEKPKDGKKGEQPDAGDQFADMGKQISQLFLSSVRYQIFLGRKFNPEKIYLKRGKEEKSVEIQKIFDATMIDIPLFAMYGEKEEPFEVVVQMK